MTRYATLIVVSFGFYALSVMEAVEAHTAGYRLAFVLCNIAAIISAGVFLAAIVLFTDELCVAQYRPRVPSARAVKRHRQ